MATLSSRSAARRSELVRRNQRNFATLIGIAALLTPLAIGSVWVISNVEQSAANKPDVLVEVLPGWTPVQIGDALQDADVIDSSAKFQEISTSSGLNAFFAGRYLFVRDSTEREALDTLRGGPARIVEDEKLLLPPGLTIAAIASRVGELPGKSADAFLQVAQSGVVRSRFQPEGITSLEGLTWPDTYFIGANETETQILERIVREFDQRAEGLGLLNAEAIGLSPYQAVIAASLVQTESGSDAESPIISAVLRNRLAQGMLLQVDATLCYAKGGCPPVPVSDDRRIESPWNTYRNPGLPPTPIATVSGASLVAALNPTADTFLFYVADPNGTTYFANTEAEHERNIERARNAD